jgi:glutathione S-transferase
MNFMYSGVSALQELLVKQSKGPYFLGEQFSAADAAVAPFLQRFKVVLENGIGSYKAKEGRALLSRLFQDEKFSRFAAYLDAILCRESVKETFPTVCAPFSCTHSKLICRYYRIGLLPIIGSVSVKPSSRNFIGSQSF